MMSSNEPQPLWKTLARLAIDSQTPTAVSALFEWIRGLTEEDIRVFSGKMTSRDALTFQAVVVAVKGQALTP